MAETVMKQATGRRKRATAQVRCTSGTGKVTVNGRPFESYFLVEPLRGYIMQPLVVTNTLGQFDLDFTCTGGGIAGQAGAARHAIARALCKENLALRAALKKAGMMTRDPREKERKKPGRPGARKRFQFSKR
jgi:small subunit ribosomal protein S9